MSKPQIALHKRHVSRKLALQAIYQWQITQQPLGEILAQFREDIDYPKSDPTFFVELVTGVIRNVEALDEQIRPFVTMEIRNIDMIERAILRLSVHELREGLETPYRVVLTEAVTLARQFGSDEGFKFVNAVLDKVAARLRPIEYQRGRQSRNAG